MRAILVAFSCLALLAGCKGPEAKLAVADAWVRLSPIPGRPAAAYFSVAGGPTADRLVAIESPKVATIELHESMTQGQAMTMRALNAIEVPASGAVRLVPGGKHAMLFGVDPAIVPGGKLPLRLRFASGKTIDANASVVSAGAAEPEHPAHQ